MTGSTMTRREQFEQQGYLIVRNVFTTEEIAQLRHSAYEHRDRQQQRGLVSQVKQAASVKGDLLSKDGLFMTRALSPLQPKFWAIHPYISPTVRIRLAPVPVGFTATTSTATNLVRGPTGRGRIR
jgi:ectoine hydroxylase-related dioxygenase (phytanoyl-CoA dioxygenase family)